MNFNFVDRNCKKCKITLTEFEVTEKNSLCIDCYKEEHTPVKIRIDTPTRLRNKKLYTA
jgi:hypothetical protein